MSVCLNPDCSRMHNADRATFCITCGVRLLLGDRYRAAQPIGAGQRSRTFLGLDTHKIIHARCVIKELPVQGKAEWLRNESVQLACLSHHPQLPDVLAYFERHQRHYLIQEFIDGLTLLQMLERHGAFDEAQIRQLLESVLPVLQFLHDHHLIHRDIKPANLIHRRMDDQIVLVDFGAAKSVNPSAMPVRGTVIGSADYTAPEQLMGNAVFASDLYSLGVTCIHLLTGMHPFKLMNPVDGTWVWRSVSGPIGSDLERALNRLLASEVGDRHPSAMAVLDDLGCSLPPSFAAISPSGGAHSSSPPDPVMAQWTCHSTIAIADEINDLCLLPDGRRVVIAGNSTLEIWDLETGDRLTRFTDYYPDSLYPVKAIALSSDGQYLASGSWDTTIRLWDLSHTAQTALICELHGHQQVVTGLLFAQDDHALISSSRDGTLRQWDVETAEGVRTWVTGRHAIEAIARDSAQRLMVSGDAEGVIQVWHLKTQDHLRTFPKQHGTINALAIGHIRQAAAHPIVLSGSSDPRALLRNLDTGEIEQVVPGHLLPVTSVAMTADGALAATGSHEGTIKLWDCNIGQLVDTLTGHLGTVEALAFSPDRMQLISGSRDGTLKVWQFYGNRSKF